MLRFVAEAMAAMARFRPNGCTLRQWQTVSLVSAGEAVEQRGVMQQTFVFFPASLCFFQIFWKRTNITLVALAFHKERQGGVRGTLLPLEVMD
jgi:hypothetical protein